MWKYSICPKSNLQIKYRLRQKIYLIEILLSEEENDKEAILKNIHRMHCDLD